MELRELGAVIDGDVVLPGDATWDTARQAWNLAVDQRPVAVVYPDVGRATSRRPSASPPSSGLRIAFNAGGHNAGPIDWGADTLLLRTERMAGITIDAGGAPRAGRGGGPVAAARRRRGRAWARVPRGHLAQRRACWAMPSVAA